MVKPSGILLLGCLLASLSGCGGGEPAKIKVAGQLVKNNQALKLHTSVMRTMIFYPYEAATQGGQYTTYDAVVNDDGTFQAPDVPPGKYLITLELMGDPGDLCKGLFTKERSKLIREVTGKEPLKIDIAKPTGE